MVDEFRQYPVTSESLRATARRSSNAGGAFTALRSRFETTHRSVLQQAAGDLEPGLASVGSATLADTLRAGQAAVWASCQLELFADAIDVYNLTSEDPRSISKLNAAFEGLHDDGMGRVDAGLRTERARLEENLNIAADEVAAALNRQPSEDEVRQAWRDGNLPVEAIGAWPGLGLRLTDVRYELGDVAITRSGLDGLTDRQLVDALADPDLNREIRDVILAECPEAVALFACEWELTTDMATRENADCSPTMNSSGQIVGPDGRLYSVTVPEAGPEPGEYVLGAPGDYIPDDGPASGWQTLGSRDGQIAYGDEVDAGLMAAFVVAGTALVGDPVGPWQSVGEDQLSYVQLEHGTSWINDGTQPAPDDPTRGPAAPIPQDQWIDPIGGLDKRNNVAWLAGAALEGLNNGQQAEYNRHFATEVTFQENDQGERRAVINLYQTQSDGDELRLWHAYGTVGPEGEIVPTQSSSISGYEGSE